jgi:hypothetical protein
LFAKVRAAVAGAGPPRDLLATSLTRSTPMRRLAALALAWWPALVPAQDRDLSEVEIEHN